MQFSYNFCLIAEGKLDALIEADLKVVDVMPLVSLVESAGGIITDWNGKKNFKDGKIIASNNVVLHKKILKLVK